MKWFLDKQQAGERGLKCCWLGRGPTGEGAPQMNLTLFPPARLQYSKFLAVVTQGKGGRVPARLHVEVPKSCGCCGEQNFARLRGISGQPLHHGPRDRHPAIGHGLQGAETGGAAAKRPMAQSGGQGLPGDGFGRCLGIMFKEVESAVADVFCFCHGLALASNAWQ